VDRAPCPVHPAAYGRANNAEVEDRFADFISDIQVDVSDLTGGDQGSEAPN
jgi:hypothetical protein